MMPQGGARHNLDGSLAPSIPAGHLDASPARLRIGQAFGQTGLARSDDARPPDRAWSALSRRIKQARVQAEAGDHADPAAHRIQQVDRGVAAVGNANDLAIGKPPRRL